MKKEYERAEIEIISTIDGEDIITTSGSGGSIGGEGEDLGGWT